MAISEVVFDLGAVLIDWNPRYLYRDIFPDPAMVEWFLATVCHHDWNLAQDAGRPWAEAEADAIARHPDQADAIRAYRQGWGRMLGQPIAGTVALLEALVPTGIGLTALSNWAADTFEEGRPRMPFLQHFRGITVSGQIGLIKPDPAIFHYHCDRFGIDPASALFIDDNAANIAAAAEIGFATHRFTQPTELMHCLKEHRLIP